VCFGEGTVNFLLLMLAWCSMQAFQSSCKNICAPQENHCEKRCEIQSGGQEIAMIVEEKLIAIILVNFCYLLHILLEFGTKFT